MIAAEPEPEPARTLVTDALKRLPSARWGVFLRELMAHAAAGITTLEGPRAASEAAYRIADAVVARGRPEA